MKKITLYCDGSSLGNPGAGGWCGILCYKDKEKVISGGEANVTNNQMELRAVIESLKALKEPCEVELVSDSKYVCEAINSWLSSWIAKNFKDVKNPILWQEYLSVASAHQVRATWVRGHSGHPYNERCDEIAREQAQKYKG